jgi:hypothetical protein
MGISSEIKKEDITEKNFYSVIEQLSSRWVITSSTNGPVSDGSPGEGSPFANAIVRTLLKCNDQNLSIIEFFTQLRKDVSSNYYDRVSIPGLGILSNSLHKGGEFCFKLRQEFVDNENQNNKEQNVLNHIEVVQPISETETKTNNAEKLLQESFDKLRKEFLSEVENKHKEFETRILEIKNTKTGEKKFDKKELNKFIANDEIEKFFEKIYEIQDLLENAIIMDLTNLQGQWRSIENQRNIGVVNSDTEYLTKNKIRRSLIELINQAK